MIRRLFHTHGEPVDQMEIDPHLVAHAVVMTVLVVAAFPWLWWTTKKNRPLHIAAAPWVAGTAVAAVLHGFFAVEGPGEHASLHASLGIVVCVLVLAQGAAGMLRSRPVVRAGHILLGKVFVGALLPLQWLIGINAACQDTTTALVGHATVSMFTAAYAVGFRSAKRIPVTREAAFVFWGGMFGLLGDLAVSEPELTPKRLQHLFLYGTFVVAGMVEWLGATRTPLVVALFVFGIVVIAHQHGGEHKIEIDGFKTHMSSEGAHLTFLMHSASGLCMLAAAAFRHLEQPRRLAAALMGFSVLFSLAQPPVCECWTHYTGAPIIYLGVALEIAAVAVTVTDVSSVKLGHEADTVSKYTISPDSDGSEELTVSADRK